MNRLILVILIFVLFIPLAFSEEFSLNEGWNLISLPVIPENNSVANVFGSVDYESVFAYVNDNWLSYSVSRPDFLNTLWYINFSQGYWVEMLNPDILTITGSFNPVTNIPLNPGWNLIGYPSFETRNITDVLVGLDYNSVFMYENGSWKSFSPDKPAFLNSLTEFRPDYGYWIKMNSYAVLTITNCVEDWVVNYGDCLVTDLMLKYYIDNNDCGTTRELPLDNGTYESCDYCVPSWSCSGYGSCLIDDTQQCNAVTDANSCYAQTGLSSDQYSGDYSEFSAQSCDYCTYNIVNTSWSSWENIGSCLINDTQPQQRNKTEYDENYDNCYALTGLSSDLWNNGNNNTYYEYQSIACDYCTPSLTNTSWSSWSNLACADSQMNQSRYRIEYDENNCGEVDNTTYYEYRLVGPDLVNTTWSGWYDITVCQPGDYYTQERNRTEYDTYGCAADTVYYEYQNLSCDYCSYNVVNSSWTGWTDITGCRINDTYEEERSKEEYDENYDSCYALTGLESDLWNSGNNNTYYEYQTLSCDYCTPSWSCSGYDSCLTNDTQQCNAVTDTNSCYAQTGLSSDLYSGDYSEFAPQSCNYCSYNIVNSSWTGWTDITGCRINDTYEEERSKEEYDDNYDNCYSVTGLGSDLWNSGNNNTYYEYQTLSCDYCVPSWSCSGYGSCLENDTQQCNAVTDTNSCYAQTSLPSDQYSGDYSEFAPQSCDYCSYNVVNSSWTGWTDITGCRANDTYEEERSKEEYDDNYDSCYAVTGLGSDLWNSGNNNTYYEYQTLSCDYCTPSWSCSGYDSCLTNDTQQCNAVTDSYDCYAETGLSSDQYSGDYSEFSAQSCDYCTYNIVNTSWSSWENIGSCLINDTQEQRKSKTEYDDNYDSCYAVTGLGSDLWNSGNNNTYYEYQTLSCDYCTPSWSCSGYDSCLTNDTQQCNAVTDTNSCYAQTSLPSDQYSGDYSEFSAQSCDYCSYNVVNTSWTGWTDITGCRINDTYEEERSREEYDENYDSCYALTGLESDLWNSGNNNTYYEYQTLSCDYCDPSWSCSGYGSCLENDTQQCNAVTDANSCYAQTSLPSDQYSGDYSEFSPQNCNYCSEDIQGPYYTGWGSCYTNDTQSRIKYYVDNNYDTCCAVTGLSSDCNIETTYVNTTETQYCNYSLLHAPTIDSYLPLTDPSIAEPNNQEFSITYSDPDSDPVSVYWYNNNSLVATNTSSYTFIGNYTSAADYNITVVISDGSLTDFYEWLLEVDNTNRAPSITLVNAPDSVNEGDLLEIDFTASDPDEYDSSLSYYIFKNGNLVSTNENYNWQTSHNDKGVYNFTFKVYDSYSDNDTEVKLITVNDTTPAMISLESPVNQYYTTRFVDVNLTTDEETNCTYSLYNGSENIIINQSIFTLDYLFHNQTIDTLQDNENFNLTVYCNDSAGNIAEDSIVFKVDTEAPNFIGGLPTFLDEITGSYQVESYYDSLDIANVTFYIADSVYNGTANVLDSEWREICFMDSYSSYVNSSGHSFSNFSCDWDTLLDPTDGRVFIKWEAYDNVGNMATYPTVFNGTTYYIDVDNTIPGDVTGMSASIPYKTDSVTLTWTNPGDDGQTEGGPVDHYNIKYSTSPITNEAEFNAASVIPSGAFSCYGYLTYDAGRTMIPGTTEVCNVTNLPGPDGTQYYFAMKAVDDVGLNSSDFDNASSPTGIFDLETLWINLTLMKNGEKYNETQNTIYLYDLVNVTGEVRNNGNRVETRPVSIRELNTVVLQQNITLEPSETREVSFIYNSTNNKTNLDLNMIVSAGNLDTNNSNNVVHEYVDVWSVASNIDLVWADDVAYPSSTEPVDIDFYVWVNLTKRVVYTFHDFPTNIYINDTFTASKNPSSYTTCEEGNKTCYTTMSGGINSTFDPYWLVDELPINTYNISVTIGNPGDDKTVSRIVTMS